MHDDNFAHLVGENLNVGEHRWVRPVGDHGPNACRVSRVSMAWLGAEDSAAVTDSDEQHTPAAVGQAHHCLDKFVVVERLLLELRGE